MTISEALPRVAAKLRSGGISSAVLDAEVLLSHVLKKPREFVLAHGERALKRGEQKMYSSLISRRLKFEPVAYLTGRKEFYGLKIKVDKRVLIPRPETELLVDEVASLANAKGPKTAILDIGTGSGAIALSLAKLLPRARIWALDTSPDALNLARNNAKALRLEIRFIKSDLLDNVKSEIIAGAILAVNLPYLDRYEIKDFPIEIKRGLKFEPQDALFASKKGTALYEKLFKQLEAAEIKPAYLVAEIGSHNWRDFLKLTKRHFPKSEISIIKDLAKRPRILKIEF